MSEERVEAEAATEEEAAERRERREAELAGEHEASRPPADWRRDEAVDAAEAAEAVPEDEREVEEDVPNSDILADDPSDPLQEAYELRTTETEAPTMAAMAATH